MIDSKGFLMTPSRYPGSSDKNRLIESRAVQACLAGADGESLGRDDLGVEVIHGFRYVEEIGACIIARREASEAFAPAIQLRKKVIGISGLFAALAIALSFGLARKFSRPIDLLTEHARRLQKGDFEGAAPIEGPSEVRTFAETFAAMTRSLKESRAALIRSEGRVRAVLENTLDAVVGIDGRGIIIDWNVRAEAIFGWNRDEAVGRRLSETIIPEKYREAHERGLALFSETGEGPILNRRIELSALRRDGEEFPVDLTVTPVQNEEETIFYAFIRDIAERKRAEGKIKFQANLLEVVGQAVIATDLNGSIIFWNRFAEKLYGWPASEASGRDVLELVPAHSRAEAAEIISRLMEGKSWSGEFPVRRRDGTVFTAMVTDTPIHDEQGRLIGMIGVSSDITERKEAEEALRKAKEALEEKMGQLQKRLAVSQTLHWISTQFARGGEIDLFLGKIVKEVAELTETAKCSIGLIDPEGKKITPQAYYGFKEERIRRVEVPMPRNENDLLFRALHRGETVMLNRILSDPRAERYREIVEMLEIQSALVTPLQVRGKSIGVVGVYDKFHGKPFSPDDLQLLQTIANQIAGAISIGRYYEDLQKIIQELRRKTIEAEEASRLKSQFLSNVSHEFRTPLNAIIGYTSLLLDKRYGPVGESQAVPLEGILRNADDLLKLVNDVLDL
ncbi:MAG TPA: PAS domain S-box protein, partial [Candidatus Manganitrophaceae bacterium]|nr:PAS domain S-box protein [Candidatus Manganitrophaceae bacterium]